MAIHLFFNELESKPDGYGVRCGFIVHFFILITKSENHFSSGIIQILRLAKNRMLYFTMFLALIQEKNKKKLEINEFF